MHDTILETIQKEQGKGMQNAREKQMKCQEKMQEQKEEYRTQKTDITFK